MDSQDDRGRKLLFYAFLFVYEYYFEGTWVDVAKWLLSSKFKTTAVHNAVACRTMMSTTTSVLCEHQPKFCQLAFKGLNLICTNTMCKSSLWMKAGDLKTQSS